MAVGNKYVLWGASWDKVKKASQRSLGPEITMSNKEEGPCRVRLSQSMPLLSPPGFCLLLSVTYIEKHPECT